jgi:prolipoprotein diacylglyceryltransferase
MVQVFLEDHFATALERTEDARDNVLVIKEGLKPSTRVNEKGQLVVEASVYSIPRHPAQVYEALSTFLLFLLLLAIWNHYKAALPEGRSFGLFMMVLFSLRFFYEFLKENQVEFEESLSLNMGQMLSLPMIAIGMWVFYRSFKAKVAE